MIDLEQKREFVTGFHEHAQMLSGPPDEASAAQNHTRGRFRTSVRALRLIVQRRCPRPPTAARGEGAAPTVRWCCPRTRSMARLPRLQLSAAVSSVKNGAALCQTKRSLFRTADGGRLDGCRERHGVARRRRAASEVLSNGHTHKSVNAAPTRTRRPREKQSSKTHRLPRRLPRLR